MASKPERDAPKDKSYQPSEQVKLEVKILTAEVAARQAEQLKQEEKTQEEERMPKEEDQPPTEPS